MHYEEVIIKDVFLKKNVLCYWEMQGIIPSFTSLDSRYLPKGQSLLIFNFGDNIQTTTENIESPFFIVPAASSSLLINQTGNINIFGISFIIDGLYKLIDMPIISINQDLSSKVYLECKTLYDKLKNKPLNEKAILAESFLKQNLITDNNSTILELAIQNIEEQKGNLKIADLCKSLCISERQMQRLFKTRIGISPKDYCKIIRVNNYMNFMFKDTPVDWMDLVVKFNYHDQPHLIKEIKSISKLSPQKLLKLRDTLMHRYHTK